MKSRVMAFAAAIIILVGAAGCATEREAQYTATGAGIGAVTGALLGAALGSLTGDAGQGAVIGSVFGGLAGASIGNSEYHQQRSEEAAAEYYAYNQRQFIDEFVLNLRRNFCILRLHSDRRRGHFHLFGDLAHLQLRVGAHGAGCGDRHALLDEMLEPCRRDLDAICAG